MAKDVFLPQEKFLSETIFNYDCDQLSPTTPTYEQVPVYEKTGDVHYEQKEQDLKSLIESNGSAFDWELESMLKAGVDVSMSIHTGSSDRLSTESQMQDLSNQIAAEQSKSE